MVLSLEHIFIFILFTENREHIIIHTHIILFFDIYFLDTFFYNNNVNYFYYLYDVHIFIIYMTYI